MTTKPNAGRNNRPRRPRLRQAPLVLSLLALMLCTGLDNATHNAGRGQAIRTGVEDESGRIQGLLDGKGEIFIPEGVYCAGDLRLYGGTRLIGTPGKTIIRQAEGAKYLLSVNPGQGGSPSPTDNQQDIYIQGIVFEGNVATEGFSEHAHLINLNAVSDLTIQDCIIKGFRGDGIYIGSGNEPGLERHNMNIRITGCLFDGITKNNRNGITVIDSENLEISGNTFKNCTREDMPGAIDIEPDNHPFHVIKNITIKENSFSNIGGNAGVIALVLPSKSFTIPPENIRVMNNTADARGNIGMSFRSKGNASDESPSINLLITGNVITNARRGIILLGLKGVAFNNNQVDTTDGGGLIGYKDGDSKNMQIAIRGNVFKRIATATGEGLEIYDIDGLSIENNMFQDCGKPDGSHGVCLNFKRGESSNVSILNNTFLSSLRGTTHAIKKSEDHVFSPKTSISHGNRFIGTEGNELE